VTVLWGTPIQSSQLDNVGSNNDFHLAVRTPAGATPNLAATSGAGSSATVLAAAPSSKRKAERIKPHFFFNEQTRTQLLITQAYRKGRTKSKENGIQYLGRIFRHTVRWRGLNDGGEKN
jgi:hypothetical protein